LKGCKIIDEGIQEWTQVSANLNYVTRLKHKFTTYVSQVIETHLTFIPKDTTENKIYSFKHELHVCNT